MSNFEPLSWELQFKLQNEGSDLLKTAKLLDAVRIKIEQTNASLLRLQKQSAQTYSSMSMLGKNGNLMNAFGHIPGGGGSGGGGGGGKKPPNPLSDYDIFKGVKKFSLLNSAILATVGSIGLLGYGLKKVYDGIESVTEKAVEAFSDRQSTLRAYSLLLGSTTQAEKEYFKAAAISQKTELTQEQTIGVQNRLITAGFRGEKLDKALLNVADLVTMRPQHLRETSANQLSELYSKVEGLGYVQEGLVNRTASRFVNTKLIREEIGKQLNLTDTGVQDALKHRKVSSDVFFNAMQSASLRQLGTKKTGEFAVGASGTLSALLSNQEEAATNLFRSITPEALPGVELYKESIKDLTEAMSYSTDTGKNLKYVLEEVSDVGTGLRAAGNEFKTGFLEEFSRSFRDTTVELGDDSAKGEDSMQKLGQNLKYIGEGVGKWVGVPLAYIVAGFKGLGGWIDRTVKRLDNLEFSIRNFFIEVEDTFGTILDNIGAFFSGLAKYSEGLYHIAKGFVSFDWGEIRSGQSMITGATFSAPSRNSSKYTLTDPNSQQEVIEQIVEIVEEKEKQKQKQKGKKEKQALEGGKRPQTGKGGGEERGKLLMFDYARDLGHGNAIFPLQGNPLGPGVNVTPLSFTPIPPIAPPQVKVDKIEIIIEGNNLSPESIADQVYAKFSQQVGRLVRAPSSGVI